MSLVERSCPLCASSERSVVLTLNQDQFTRSNPTYRLDRLPRLGLDPGQLYPIVRCEACEMIYSLYHLDDEREALVYNEIIDADRSRAKVLSPGRRRGDLVRCLSLLSLIDDGERLTMLDYGCGWGTLLRVARGAGIDAVGFDATSWKTEWARQHGVEVFATRDEVERRGPFDLLVCTSVLEHLHDPAEAVAWIAEVMKPGGVALIDCVINQLATPESRRETQRRVAAGEPIAKEVNPWEHLNYFSPEQLRGLLGKHGLRPVQPKGEWLLSEGRLGGLVGLARSRVAALRGRHPSGGYWRFSPDADSG